MVLALPGCAHYEYDIVQPPDVAGHIGENADTVFTIKGLLFRLRSADNYLVIRIHNPGGEAVRLIGGDSYVVDPHGQSHPLPGQVIAPQAWIRLILPPLPPPPAYVVEPGIGVTFAGGGPEWYSSFTAPLAPGPHYYVPYPHDYWEWAGETDVRLSLTFQRGNEPPFTQQFLFHRRRVR